MKAFSPTGKEIVGTLETLSGVAYADNYKRDEFGVLDFEYIGDTKVYWDEQKTVERKGERIFIDEEGEEWTEKEIVLR